jgi:DNA-directed RNA polymerase specialized sigma24 family protein
MGPVGKPSYPEGVALPDQEDGTEEVQRVIDSVRETVDSLVAMDDDYAKAAGAGALLKSLPEEQQRLRKIRHEAVVRLRADNVSYREIARRIGVSLARVQQIEAEETGRATRRKTAEPSEE